MTRRAMIVAGLAALATLMAGACGDGAGIPQPIPIPHHLRAMSAPPDRPITVDVVGLPGAVAGTGRVLVTGAGGSVREARSTAAGSFTLSLQARGGDTLQVRYEDSAAAALPVPKQGIMAPLPPGPIAGVPPVTAIAGGRVQVRGQSNSAGTRIVGVNTVSGDVAQTTAAGDQRFSLDLSAASGDAMRVYEEIGGVLGPAWSLTAP